MWRIAIVATLGALLSGCFGSDNPMFAPETAVRAFEGGRYALFEQYGDPKKPSEYMEVRQRGSVYDFINEKGAVHPVTFHPIAGGIHIAQIGIGPQGGSDRKGYAYALFQISGRETRVYVADCNKQDKAMLAAARVERRADYECNIDKVADPAGFFAKLKRNEPPVRLVRE